MRNNFNIRFLFICAFALLFAGCSPLVKMTVPTEHVVMFDKDGKPLNPTGNFWFSEPSDPGADPIEKYHTDLAYSYPDEKFPEYEKHTDRIINKMMTFESPNSHVTDSQGKPIKKIMLFIHGGLNTQVGSIERLIEDPESTEVCNSESNPECKPRYKRIEEAGYFPLFINWKSSLVSSYWENLFFLRQGKSNPFLGIPTSPSVFATDVGRSLLRWPIVAGSLIKNDISTIPYSSENTKYPGPIAKELLCRYQYPYEDQNKIPGNYKNKWTYKGCLDEKGGLKFSEPPYPCPFSWQGVKGNSIPETVSFEPETFAIRVGNDSRKCTQLLFNFARYAPTLPLKLLTMPVVDAFGTGSWDVMLRHVDLLFHSEAELQKSDITDTAWKKDSLATIPKHGGLSLFLQKLAEKIKADKTATWEITLVGHSMGAIVANQLIRNYGENLPIKNIIYLAAATTVHDYENTIYPYLSKDLNNRHMYHFLLHPRAEEGENMFYELVSRGSLLVWIDNFLSKPLSPMDRTVGRYDNLLSALHNADPSIRKQISLRVYSAGDSAEYTNPQTHSDVAARFKFWEEACWKPNPQAECIFPKH